MKAVVEQKKGWKSARDSGMRMFKILYWSLEQISCYAY
jgi:hypothetical protein